MRSKRTLAERFWAKVDRSGGPLACWIWLAAKNQHGHGMLNVDGKTMQATHVSLMFAGRPLRPGEQANHDCPGGDNPSCVNPDHLWAGSQLENLRDMDAKGRANRNGLELGRCRRGENHHSVKLDYDKVAWARKAVAAGYSFADVGYLLDVATGTVFDAVKGKTWRAAA